MQIPEEFSRRVAGRRPDAAGRVSGDRWLAELPARIAEHLERWALHVEGPAWFGENALVVPVRRDDDGPAALKLTWPHVEARHEHLALRLWDGAGAVRLLAANPSSHALLLERLDGDTDLTGVPILQACEEIGTLFRRLDREAPAQVDAVVDKAERWREQLERFPSSVPRRLSEQALSFLHDLIRDAPTARLVHEDLHDMNVLAPLDPGRGNWLAIDPKPVAGEWAYAVAPIVWNRWEVTATAYSLRTHVRLRAQVVADVAGLDVDRVQQWTFVRLVLNAVWAAEHRSANDFRGRMITLAKAFVEPLD